MTSPRSTPLVRADSAGEPAGVLLGVIGCGAVAEMCHLPAIRNLLAAEQVWFADSDLNRSKALAESLGVPDHVVTDYRDLIGTIQAAVVAVPNDLHVPIACDLLENGVHVLCEKPLATTVEGAEAILRTASRGSILAVGNVRRFFPSTRFVAHILRAGIYGRPLRFNAEDGVPFDWHSSSGFLLERERSGGGVLIDAGAHVLDQLCFWFGPELEICSYEDDAHGGVESECAIELRIGSVMGTVEMSRTRQLRNTIRIECEHGTIEAPLSELAKTMTLAATNGGGYSLEVDVPDESIAAHEAQLRDFLSQTAGGLGSGASGEEGLRVLRLVEDCYSRRSPLDEPWVTRTLHQPRPTGDLPRLDTVYRRILVTGASGFLGCRLSEHLRLEHDVTVRGMIHRPERAMRLARLDVELVRGDLADASSLAAAMNGCDAVVHCAIASGGSPDAYRFLTGRATGTVAQAALDARVERFVHISSVAVHGYAPPKKVVDEETEMHFTGDAYADGKIEAEEEIAAAAGRGLPVVVLRPTNIFGPYSTTFTINPIEDLKNGRVALVGDGSGAANTAYVDNVVHAIVLALRSDRAIGERFVVSDDDGTTWRELYDAYVRLISRDCEIRSAPFEALFPAEPEVAGSSRHSARSMIRSLTIDRPAIRAVGRGALAPLPRVKDRLFDLLVPPAPATSARAIEVVEVPPDSLPSRGWAEIQSSGTHYSAQKARDVLGYEPPVPFGLAIELTGEWLRFARLT